MKTSDYFLHIILTTLLCFAGTKTYAHDIEVENADGVIIYYVYTNNNTELAVSYYGTSISYSNNEYSGDVVIPESVTYNGIKYSVTSIGSYAFSGCSGLTSVTIPNSVTSIGNQAFDGCTGLTSVTIPNSVTSIGEYAFYNCSSLTSVTIPNSVTSIGSEAFEYCSGLTSITIPNSVSSIGSEAFSGCSGLTSIVVVSGNTFYDSRNNCNAIIEKATGTLILGCQTTIIPNGVTSIGNGAFLDCSGLTSVTIPNSVTNIGGSAFFSCDNLTSVTIGNSVTSIGNDAFYHCKGLTYVNIPNSVKYIGSYAFYYCESLPFVTIGNSVTYIGFGAFSNCYGLTSVTIGNSVTSIGSEAFNDCSGLTSITIPNSVASIEEYAFSHCSGLTSIVVESGNTCYDSRDNCNAIIETATGTLIRGCQTTIIPNSVTSIGNQAFDGCTGLTSVTIPNSVTSIGRYAFSGCSGLTSLTIGNSVTSIGNYAFYRCSGLTSVISKMENPCTIDFECFTDDVFYNSTLYVPQGTTNKYKSTQYWSKFLFIEEGDPSGGSSEPETCAKPTISYNNGKLMFNSSTEGVSYSYLITDTDIKAGTGEEVNLTVTYNVSVYASKLGYLNSETATGTLCWIDTTPTTEGITGIAQIPANAVLIQANDGFISISGLDESKQIAIYQTDGKQVATAKAYNGSASVAINICKGTPVIVKIGEKAVKVVMQ